MEETTTVLIAEDEGALRRLYVTWLDQAGYNVRSAKNGEEALAKWDDDVDAVLLDRRMPEKYGDEVLEDGRENGYHTPVAMITAVNPDLDLVDMPFDEYIIKPTTKEELTKTVNELNSTSEIRGSVREFVRAGIKIHKLQQEHSNKMLQTHAEYQELKSSYKDLRQEISNMVDDLTVYEKELLIEAREKV